jgi:hypothetical protein
MGPPAQARVGRGTSHRRRRLRAIKRYIAIRTEALPWLFISERGQPLTRQFVNLAISAARSAGGISPPAAYRTVRKSLDLHGSSQLFSRNLTITGLRGKMIAPLDFSIGEDFL